MTAIFAVAHVVVDEVTKSLGVQDSGWAIFAACAAAAAAIATAVLALLTRNLARATRDMAVATKDMLDKSNDMMANENTNHRVSNTIRLVDKFTQTPIHASEDVALTAHVASAKLQHYARKHETLKALQSAFALKQPKAEKEYDILLNCFAIVDNYFMTAYQEYSRGVLDKVLFMTTFAGTYIETVKAMDAIGVEAPDRLANAKVRDELKDACERWLRTHATDP